jgi:predicted HTH transcriptional regulator
MPAPAPEISLPIPRAPEPEPMPEPAPESVQASTPSHLTEKQIKWDTSVAPAKHDPKFTKDIPKRVLDLTDEEINAARLLWAREHIAGAQKQSNLNRKINMNNIMSEIEAVVRANPNTTTHAIANSVKLSEKSTSGYIQKLVKAGRIKAAGNSRNRKYFV